ncbi:MAG: RND family transporter [Acidobacteria bacterium]|nr:MAG: RND family transporter [Acidobacteriota bacterium]
MSEQAREASERMRRDRRRAAWVALAFALLVAFLVAGLTRFRMEATSDSIVLENDRDLRFYDETRRVFGSDAELYVAVQQQGDLFSRETLDALAGLTADLAEVDGVDAITSLLSVPLFHSPSVGLLQLARGYRTLSEPDIDLELARREVLGNPLYSGSLIGEDGEVTIVQLRLDDDEELSRLEFRRYDLRQQQRDGALDASGEEELERVEREYRERNTRLGDARREQIAAVREAISRHEGGELQRIELGGVPMIAVDIVRYVERDIALFGVAVVVFVLIALAILLRDLKWTLLVTATCAVTVLSVCGLLGWLDWRTTIVTSNLSSLLFIITMAMSVHLVMRYRELHARTPGADQAALTRAAVRAVWWPTLFTAITTVVGFGSLYVSGIRPVMDFALMMSLGIACAVVFVFGLLPAAGLLWPDGAAPPAEVARLERSSWRGALAALTLRHPVAVTAAAALLLLAGLAGAARLEVENRFMDYFADETPIHRGMVFLDRHLGGTTPLEISIELDDADAWLQRDNLAALRALPPWLAEQPEIGTVTSLDSMVRIVEKILANDPSPLLRQAEVNAMLLRTLRAQVPEETARLALGPYVDDDYSHTRVLARVVESDRELDRSQLLQRIDTYLEDTAFAEVARPTGMFVLYNNMLQSLYASQIQTIAAVFAAIGVTFWILFRSLRVALVALVPNLLPTVVVLGFLGWAGVPLNMMTIMIAAVTLGIAVDDTTHYLHRFRHELRGEIEAGREVDERALAVRCHNSVGRAIVTTTVAITAGFAILTLSNFVPTVQFGLLTGLAMGVALLADLALLPILLAFVRPFGRGATAG